MTTKTYDKFDVDSLPDLNEGKGFNVDELPDLKKKEESPFDYKRQTSRSGGIAANQRQQDSGSESRGTSSIKMGYGKSTLDNDIDNQFDLSLNNPELYKPKSESELSNLYYNEVSKRFTGLKEGTKAEIKSSPESLSNYAQKRVGEINDEIKRHADDLYKYDIKSESASHDADLSTSSKVRKNKEDYVSKITELNLYKDKFKNSVVQEASKSLTPKYIMDGYDPRKLGREIVRIADPELNAKYEEVEKTGSIPPIQNAQLERLGLELGKNFLQNQEQTPEVQQKLAEIKQNEADFDMNNFELTAQMVKDKLGVYFYKKGKSGFWGYADKNIEQAINDPELNLSESEKKVALEYVLPTEKKLFFSTDIPGSGFFRSAKGAIEKSLLNTGNSILGKLGQRGDPERAYESLNAPIEESRFTAPGEGATLQQAYGELVNKQNDGTITEEEKLKKDQLVQLLNVRTKSAKLRDGMGDLIGQAIEMIALTKGIGLAGKALTEIGAGGGILTGGATSSAIGNALTNNTVGLYLGSYFTAYDSYRKQALDLIPGDQNADKREAYSNSMGFAEGATEGIFNDVKALKAFSSSVAPTMRNITTRLLNKEITQRVAKEEMTSALSRYIKPFGKEFFKAEYQNSLEEASVDWAQGMADAYFGGQPFDVIATGNKALNKFLTTAINSPLVSAAAAHGAARQNRAENAFFKTSIVQMGLNPTESLSAVEDLELHEEITPEEAEEKKQIILKSQQYIKELPEGIDSPAAATYITHRLNEDILNEQIAKTNDPVVAAPLKEQLQRSIEIRKGIFDGTIGVTPDTQEVTNDPDVAEQLDILDAEKVNDEDLIGTPFEKPLRKEPSPSPMVNQTEGAAETSAVPSTLNGKSDPDIENRMSEIEGDKGNRDEFNSLEKEMEKRERATVFNVPLDKVNDAVDALIQKEKDKPNGYGSFIEKRDARETKEVTDKYLNPKEISDTELRKDFIDAVLGNPDTWYADGLKLRESMKEAANRGIDIKEMVAEIEKEYIKDGYTSEDAKATVARKLAPIYEGSKQQTTPTEQKVFDQEVLKLPDNWKEIKGKEVSIRSIDPETGNETRTPMKVSEAYVKLKRQFKQLDLVLNCI